MPRRRLLKNSSSAPGSESIAQQLKSICRANFNTATCINFILMSAYYLIFVTGTGYIRKAYATSLSLAGFSSGIMVIGSLTGRFICGNLVGFVGFRTLVAGGILLFAAANAALFYSHPWALFFPCVFLRASALAYWAQPQRQLWPG